MSRRLSIMTLFIGLLILAIWRWNSTPTGSTKNNLIPFPRVEAVVLNFPPNLLCLQKQLKDLNKVDALALILAWLDSGRDDVTGRELRLATDGSLLEAPTLRTYLLDQLSKVDRVAAAEYAKKILTHKTSADEWALALRAYALVNTNVDAMAYLKKKFRELVQDEKWRTNPSVGFLEAFDVAVYAGDTGLTTEFSTLLADKSNRATAHAAYLTMDRLVQTQPEEMLAELQSHPDWMANNQLTRADFFARADVRDEKQLAVLENYLLNSSLSPVELQQFAGVFPNANYMISHNLLTGTTTPNGADLAARDQASLQTVNGWLADPRFAGLHAQLETIQQRLQLFIRQSAGK